MFNRRADRSRIKDPGFGEKVAGQFQRIINKDGSFNVEKKGGARDAESGYQYMLELPTGKFFFLILLGFVVVNLIFGLLYYLIGTENLIGVRGETPIEHFMDCIYFSTQTFTTVGYGAIAPRGILASTIASFEAMFGLLSFALATGLLYSRFSKPKAELLFSRNALIAPFEGGNAFMFRFANQRSNALVNVKAEVILMMLDLNENNGIRKYYELKLQMSEVLFLAVNWTLVHKVDEESPLYGLGSNDLIQAKAEVLILVSGYDDVFNQTVHTRFSYTADEWIFGARFKRAFYTDEKGKVALNLEDIHAFEMVEK
jgi:inward rectifier potassium channel